MTLTDDYYKKIMQKMDCPNNDSILLLLRQMAHDVEVLVREECAQEVIETGHVIIWRG